MSALASPDEAELGKAEGYPVAHSPADAYQEGFRVGSFSAMDTIRPSCTLAPATHPISLVKSSVETSFRYRFHGVDHTLDDYLQRQRATAVIVLKEGQIVAERYGYDRTAQMRMISQSMAKTIVALGIGKALEEHLIRSLDDVAATYAPELSGTLYGETTIINLLRMASGARYVEDYSSTDDRTRFNAIARKRGVVAALRSITDRADPQGERFNYSGAQTDALGLVLRGATHRTLCDYIDEKIWQPIGAEGKATWLVQPSDHLEIAQGGFNSTARDYARLGLMLANDGVVGDKSVIAPDYLLAMTDPERQPPAFRPSQMPWHNSTYIGYGLQVWLLPGSHRRFVLQGIYGQAIFVDPQLKLVMVHTAVGRDASGDASGTHLASERDALFRGIVATYGKW